MARALVINGIVFFITQTPFRIHSVNQLAEKMYGAGFLSQSQGATVELIGRGFMFINSTVNSFIYGFSCKFYRDGFREALFCSVAKNKKIQTVSVSTSVTNVM